MPNPVQPAAESMDVRYVAHLARLRLTEDEQACFQAQLGQVLDHVRQLNRLDVDGVEPTAHAFPVQNVFRPDVVQPGLDHDQVMANAPAERQGQFIGPRIIE